jgi:RHS repeat-associated protein
VVARQWYYPYGAVRGSVGTLPTQRTFTGQYSDATGLMYFNARYYSGALGRFVSADTLVPGAGNPQALNRYAFVLNNPLRYTDPSGHSVECGLGDPYCIAGKLDVQRRARDLAANLARKKTSYAQVTVQQKSILTEGGFGNEAGNEAVYNDFVGGNVADIGGTLEDPAIYASAAAGVTLKLGAALALRLSQLAGAYCINYSRVCATLLLGPAADQASKALQAQPGTSYWPSGQEGRQVINGVTYSVHALRRMEPDGFGGRGVPPSVVENALRFGLQEPSDEAGWVWYVYENVRVLATTTGEFVRTVIKTGH